MKKNAKSNKSELDEMYTKAAEFHKSRIAFAILSNGEYVITKNDEREHIVWLREDYDISDEEFETLVRGYIKPGKIMFYKSSSFSPIKDERLLLKYIEEYIGITVLQNFKEGIYSVSNGVKIGKIGEEWEAYSSPYIVNISGSFTRKIHNINIQIL